MKIAICSPLSREEPAFRKSLDDLLEVLRAQDVEAKCFHTYGDTGMVRVRNAVAEKAMLWEPDYLFWVDDDMMFNNDIVERLLSRKKDFICALMFSKNLPFIPTIKKVQEGSILSFNNYLDYPLNSLVEIAGCGFAATLIHRRIFEDLIIQADNGREYFAERTLGIGESEDINFCLRARQKGHKIWCDTGVKTRHIGGMGIGEENFQYWYKTKGMAIDQLWM